MKHTLLPHEHTCDDGRRCAQQYEEKNDDDEREKKNGIEKLTSHNPHTITHEM